MEQVNQTTQNRSGPEHRLGVLLFMFAAWWSWSLEYFYVDRSWPMSPLLLAIVVGSAYGTAWAASRHRVAMVILVALSPVVVGPLSVVCSATREYVRGEAYLGTSLEGAWRGADEETGLPLRAVHGCVVDTLIIAERDLHNATTRFLVRQFGPPEVHLGPAYDDEP